MTYHNAGFATVLRADELPHHRELPDGWTRTMGKLIQYGGPWPCRNGHASLISWRCSVCGVDLIAPE